MQNFMFNIAGQLNSVNLSLDKGLLALFETIVNSIQSIEDSKNKLNGRIDIHAYREELDQFDINGNIQYGSFCKFTVVDNGCGFTEKNYESFLTAYSDLKITKGCKGIGRFLWLKAFERVEINSVYLENDKWTKRDFVFSEQGIEPDNNISDYIISDSTDDNNNFKTSVTLYNYLQRYKEKTTKNIELLAEKIVEHCLLYFLSDNCPTIILHDEDENVHISLNEIFHSQIKDSLHQDILQIEGEEFTLYHLRVPGVRNKNALHLCADSRDVCNFKLDSYVPDLDSKLVNEDGEVFTYVGYIKGDHLDQIVNANRTAFDYKSGDVFIGKDALIEVALNFIKLYLKDELDIIGNKKRESVDKFIHLQAPKYRHLIKSRPDVYDRIKPNCDDNELELELHRLEREIEMETIQETKLIEQKVKDGNLDDDFEELMSKYCAKVNDLSKASLSEYVVRRKVILDILLRYMQYKDKTAEYEYEKQIHQLIFPLNNTADDIDFMSHNLWIIDEKLAYHQYIASDKELKDYDKVEQNSENKPDIMIFDQVMAVVDEDFAPYNNVTLIEFKRPGRNDYTANKNPIEQIKQYIEDIDSGKMKTKNGRPISANGNSRYFCYIIADITPTLSKIIKSADFLSMPDGIGYYRYYVNYSAYIEIIPYDKLYSDARLRNKILFDKLFAPDIDDINYLQIDPQTP